MKIYSELVLARFKEEAQTRNKNRRDLLEELDKINTRMQNARIKMVDGFLSAEDFQQVKETCLKQASELEKKLDSFSSEQEDITQVLKKTLTGLEHLSTIYESGTLSEKRQLLGSIFSENLVFDGIEVRTPRPNEGVGLIYQVASKLRDWEQKNAAETSVATNESNFKQDDQGRLTLVTFSRTESRKDSTGVYASSTDEETYEFVYNTEGFLTELKRRDLQLQQGSANFKFGYATLRYRVGKMETTSVTSFVYSEGRLQSSKYVSSLVVQGDNLPAATFPESYTINYKYDSKGNIQTATSDGWVANYTNGIRTSSVSADGKSIWKYDDQGRMISYSVPYDQRTFKYDQRGNQIFQDSYDNGEFVFSTETKFDEHTNPDNMIPSRYKGIPDPIKVTYADDNPNNMIESTVLHRNDTPLITSNVWTYHPNGLPATSTMKTGTDFYKTTLITKFKYENCD